MMFSGNSQTDKILASGIPAETLVYKILLQEVNTDGKDKTTRRDKKTLFYL